MSAPLTSPNQPIGAASKSCPPAYTRSQLETLFLPVGQMLQLDRVCEIQEDQIICEMDIQGHWVFPMHFPADPIFPGTLLIEAAGQVVAVWAWHAGLRGRPRLVKVSAKFKTPVLPQDQAVTLRGKLRLRRNICVGMVELSVLGRTVAEIEPLLVIV